ncbi:hypothetical protein ACOSQ3_027629 [Xanthoceras sorbifolium]
MLYMIFLSATYLLLHFLSLDSYFWSSSCPFYGYFSLFVSYEIDSCYLLFPIYGNKISSYNMRYFVNFFPLLFEIFVIFLFFSPGFIFLEVVYRGCISWTNAKIFDTKFLVHAESPYVCMSWITDCQNRHAGACLSPGLRVLDAQKAHMYACRGQLIVKIDMLELVCILVFVFFLDGDSPGGHFLLPVNGESPGRIFMFFIDRASSGGNFMFLVDGAFLGGNLMFLVDGAFLG